MQSVAGQLFPLSIPDIFARDGAKAANDPTRQCTSRANDQSFITKFKDLIAEVTARRSKVATLPAARDEDAMLKRRLSGVRLETTILTIDYYR